ncbi:MAG: methionine adenosyltransferase [Kiritimatiellae bacterium]|nr:methionine adenosyltransferase [Kiritimatiellia bacterium]
MNQTAESVTEGHPDKVADYIADSILDACLLQDAHARVACEVLCKGGTIVLAGEITSEADLDYYAVAREAISQVGYGDPGQPFTAARLKILTLMSRQSSEISCGVGRNGSGDIGAGDQGIMTGYATDETSELMPLPILLAHRLTQRLAADRREKRIGWLRPDGKAQVTVAYEGDRPILVTDVIVSAQHEETVDQGEVRRYVEDRLLPSVLGAWLNGDVGIHVNPAGSFVHGGPSVDCGLTGRKNIVDTYGPTVPHGGGSFSGKDPTKVDRSAAYFCRYVARRAVQSGIAHRVLVRVAYAIGESSPVALDVETFGTGDEAAALDFVQRYDFRPAAIIEQLHLRRPIYRSTTNYGHFGRPGFPWELTPAV